jgi:hypothetical protein
MKIDEVCTKNFCLPGAKRRDVFSKGSSFGHIDTGLADAADAKDEKAKQFRNALSDKDSDTYYDQYMAADSPWQGHQAGKKAVSKNKPKTLMQAVGEASFDLPSSDFRHTEKFTVNTGKELEFAKYIARQLETMGVTKEQATRLYKASKDGDYSWVERFGKSPKLKQLIGHNIGTAMTTNAVAIHNGMGLLAGLLKIQPKQTKIPTPSQVPDDLQPGGHDTDEYLRSKDNKQARQYYDRDMNWSGLR